MWTVLKCAKKFRWHIFAVILGVYTALQYSYSKRSTDRVYETQETHKETRKITEIKNAILKQNIRIVGKYCGESPNSCFTIEDRASTDNGRLIVKRYLMFKDTPEFSVTAVELKAPEVLTWQNFNTRHWPVNKLVVTSLYAKLMIAMGFIMEAMRFEDHGLQNVLMIGLGGGLMNNFLSAIDNPMINLTTIELDSAMVDLATKWFGVLPCDRNKIFVEDGSVFVRGAKEREEKYKSIILDACYNEKHPRICPVAELAKASVIQDIADVLHENGVLTVNILCSRDAIAIEDNLLSTFRKHFQTCFLLRYNANQRMLICTHRKNWSFDDERNRFMKNCRIVDERFSFQLESILSEI